MVIGSGALGASIAFHSARGRKQVALVDKHALGPQTSLRGAGLTSQARGTDLMTTLAKQAVRKIEAFEHETGEAIVFHQLGRSRSPAPPSTSRSSVASWSGAAGSEPGSRRSRQPRRGR